MLLLHTSHFLITEKPPFGLSPAQRLNWNKEQRNKKRRQTNIKCYHKRKDVDKEINEEKVSRMSQWRKEQKRSLQQKEEEKENGRKREREMRSLNKLGLQLKRERVKRYKQTYKMKKNQETDKVNGLISPESVSKAYNHRGLFVVPSFP